MTTAATAYARLLEEELQENLVAVILFGSVARGEATAGSDIDLLVVCETLPAGREDAAGSGPRRPPLPGHGRGRLLARRPGWVFLRRDAERTYQEGHGGNHGEAQAPESVDDFIHKMQICLKELRETRRWLRLIERKRWLHGDGQLAFGLRESDELVRIFNASIQTAARNRLARRRAGIERSHGAGGR